MCSIFFFFIFYYKPNVRVGTRRGVKIHQIFASLKMLTKQLLIFLAEYFNKNGSKREDASIGMSLFKMFNIVSGFLMFKALAWYLRLIAYQPSWVI